MRIRLSKTIAIVVFALNLLVLIFMCRTLAKLTFTSVDTKPVKSITLPSLTLVPEFVETKLTIVIRGFEHFENDVLGTVESFLSVYPNIRILIVSDVLPYPPINLRPSNYSVNRVKIITQNLKLTSSFEESNPLSYIHTKYVLFVPDSTRIHSERVLNSMMMELKKQPGRIVSAGFSDTSLVYCLKINLNIREWHIEYSTINSDVCDSIRGKHVILITTELLKKLPQVFMVPFPEALYIQTAAQNIKVKLMKDVEFTEGKQLYRSQHAQWKIQQFNAERQQKMFHGFGLKKVVRETGVTEWYGCNRDTPRCFGSVIADIPQYLWEDKWTPPCCLAGLRRTAHHVFARLDEAGIRYWLEGGSLLGAMRSGDILPWDYDIDIGFYREDIPRCPWLVQAQVQPVRDSEGFVWEKAVEGDFFRVQFSQINHLHVDLFPFYERNGTMTKDTWFLTHKQDREFPEYYLRPLSTIEFVGRQVPAPNNIRDFLELKFGKNSIENPEYPNPSKLKFAHENYPKPFTGH